MVEITTEFMQAELQRSRQYTVALLRPGPNYEPMDSRSERVASLIWAHGKRNFELRAAGQMAMVGPGMDIDLFCGMAVFAQAPDAVRILMDADPAIAAGIFTYELGRWRSFPGDQLPQP